MGHKWGQTYKVHLDGHNILDLLTGKTQKSPRDKFFYVSDDGKSLAIRTGDWKVVFAEQRAKKYDVWRDPFVDLRTPKLFHLRRVKDRDRSIWTRCWNSWKPERVPAIKNQLGVES
jgi:arylsulfatase